MENIISGLVVAVVTQIVKRVPQININEGDKVKLRVLVGVLSLAGAVITAYMNGQLASPSTIELIGGTVTNFIFATISYYGLIK